MQPHEKSECIHLICLILRRYWGPNIEKLDDREKVSRVWQRKRLGVKEFSGTREISDYENLFFDCFADRIL